MTPIIKSKELEDLSDTECRRLIDVYKQVIGTDASICMTLTHYAEHIYEFVRENPILNYSTEFKGVIKKLLSLSLMDFVLLQSFLANCWLTQRIPEEAIAQLHCKGE